MISEQDRKTALDIFGKMLIESRDMAIIQWDQTLAGKRQYAPWSRILQKYPDLDEHSREVLKDALPHIIDTFMYCFLSNLEEQEHVHVSVRLGDVAVEDIAHVSWGLAAEPTTEQGWLVRFSKQRFEQPG